MNESLAPGAGDPADPPPPGLVTYVDQLQDDLRVLIRHVTGRVDKRAITGRPATEPGAPNDFHVGLILLTPQAIARDRSLLEQLYQAIAALTVLSAPADVASIRLTHAFVRGDLGHEASPYVRAEARRLLRWAWLSALFGLFVFFLTIALLIHVDRGRRAIQQLEMTRANAQTIDNDFTVARTAAASDPSDAAGAPPCPDDAPTASLSRAAQQDRVLCRRMREVDQRITIIHRELRNWNIISERLSYASPLTWFQPRLTPVAGLSENEWQSTELRTAIMMTALSGFVLPMLLGLLGACVYVYRELDAEIEAYTLQAREGVHGTLRMLLGAILGGLLGAIWTNGQAIHLEGVSLSLGALAFFVGFSVEVVFRLVDTLVRAVADRIGKPTP